MTTVKLALNGAIEEIDLTKYLDVEAGKGMEPGDPHFTNKVFAHSLLKQGGTLALEDLQLKELVFPVKLKAASKAALAALVQQINRIMNTPETVLEWQDEGTATVTYFDLASGQFDDEYDYRLGVNNWLKGKLRLFTQPLGYPTPGKTPEALTVSGIATTTAVASVPLVVFTGASAVRGDGPALLGGIVEGENTGVGQPYVAMSLLPAHSYVPLYPAASGTIVGGVGSSVATSNAISGSFARLATQSLGGAPAPLRWTFFNEGVKPGYGNHRLLMIARTASIGGVVFRFGNAKATISVATVTNTSFTEASGEEWRMYDMGILSLSEPEVNSGATTLFELSALHPTFTGTLDIAGAVMLPENSTTWLHDSGAEQTKKYTYDPVAAALLAGGGVQHDRSGLVRGALPQLPAQATAPVVAFLYLPERSSLNRKVTATVNVLPRTRYIF